MSYSGPYSTYTPLLVKQVTNHNKSQYLTTMSSYSHLSGPDFLKLSRQQINELPLDELQLLVLRSQQLLTTALFKPVQCMFEVMPDEFMLSIFLEWLPIEDLASFDRALTNHYYRPKYLSLLKHTVHSGVLSISTNEEGYSLDSGVAEWLEDRMVFMCALKFYGMDEDLPVGFLEHTGRQLLKIDLSGCPSVSDARFKELVECCPKLEDVDLSHCFSISDVGVASLVRLCPGLHTLSISGTHVTEKGLASFGEDCRNMKKINLEGLAISDTGLQKIAKVFPNLEDVDLSRCPTITDVEVASLVLLWPGLHTLDLSRTQVTDTGLASLGEGCRALKKISLYRLEISDSGLLKIAQGCPWLEDVDLERCSSITDVGATSLAQLCPRLHTLSLEGTHVTETGLDRIGEGCKALKTLNISGLEISDSGLLKIAQGCPWLEDVDLERCSSITDVGATSLAQLCPGLRSLDLYGTKVEENKCTLDLLHKINPALLVYFDNSPSSSRQKDLNHKTQATIFSNTLF